MQHRWPNNIPLPTLSLQKKSAITALILLGYLVFGVGWLIIVGNVYWDLSDTTLGAALGMLAVKDQSNFAMLFSLHLVSTLMILAPTMYLLRLTSIRRRVRALISGIALMVVALDITAWLWAPNCGSSNLFVGFAGLLACLTIVGLSIVPLYQIWIFRRWQPKGALPKRVVIVGGGFGGLYAALSLNKILGYHPALEITLLDKNNYFLFPPLLPGASVGAVEHRDVSFPFRRIFETTNVRFTRLQVTAIDQGTRTVRGKSCEGADEEIIPFDILVFAPGATTNTFGTPGAETHALFMRELPDASKLRNRIVDLFEQAASTSDREEQCAALRFVVVGAGATGIETATEISDLIHKILLKRYPEIDPTLPKVTILQSGESVLPGWHRGLQETTHAQVTRLGIELKLGVRVKEVTPHGVTCADGTFIHAHTVIWCAGVKPSPIVARSGLTTDTSGRIPVRDTMQSIEHDHVFVLGDAAAYTDPASGRQLPPLAQVAFQQGKFAGKAIANLLSNRPLGRFSYFDYGSLVSVGEHFAAIRIMGISLSGFIAWFIWRSLYLAKLPGISNRIRIVVDWTLDLLIERSITQTNAPQNLASVEMSS